MVFAHPILWWRTPETDTLECQLGLGGKRQRLAWHGQVYKGVAATLAEEGRLEDWTGGGFVSGHVSNMEAKRPT